MANEQQPLTDHEVQRVVEMCSSFGFDREVAVSAVEKGIKPGRFYDICTKAQREAQVPKADAIAAAKAVFKPDTQENAPMAGANAEAVANARATFAASKNRRSSKIT